MDKLKKVYSDDRKPRKDVMREIVTQLTYAYPKMFREYEGKGSRLCKKKKTGIEQIILSKIGNIYN